MKRPLVWAAVSVLAAVLCAVAGYIWCVPLFLIGQALAIMIYCQRTCEVFDILRVLQRSAIFACVYSMIFLTTYLYALQQVALPKIDSLFDEYNKIKITVRGKVDSVSVKDYGITLIVSDCTIIAGDSRESNIRLLVNIYNEVEMYTPGCDITDIETGDVLEFAGSATKVASPRNDGEFDAKTYYKSVGIYYKATADYIVSIDKVEGLQAFLNKLKARFDYVYEAVADDKDTGVLKAVVLGDKDYLEDDLYKLYQENGIAHLLAISGLHVSFVGMLLYRIMKRLVSGYIVPFVTSTTVLALYAVMTGNGVSAKRAVIMCVICMGADVLGRTYDAISGLSLVAILLIWENVLIIYNTSFLMSFGAILGIAVVSPALNQLFIEPLDIKSDKLDRKRQIVKRQVYKSLIIVLSNLLGSISVSLVTLPIILYQYYQIPIYSIFLNIIVIPLMSLVLLCAILTALVGVFSIQLGTFFMGTVHYILKLYTFLCEMFSRLPGNIVVTGKPEIVDCIVYYVILGAFVVLVSAVKFKKIHKNEAWTGKRKKALLLSLATPSIYILIILVAVIVLIPQKGSEGLVVRMIDVGQGDCIFVQYGEETYLFDGGSSDIKNVGERRIYPCLRSHGITEIDYVFVSHTDSDHTSGILELMNMQDETFVIKNIVMPDIKDKEKMEKYMALVSESKAAGINVLYVKKGDSYSTSEGDLRLDCIHPTKEYDYESANDYSAVYRLEYGEFSMLFTGDVEAAGERAMMDAVEETTVLKVAHHGSRYSSSEELLEGVLPKVALISCGIDNAYGHPHKDTLKRLRNTGAKIYVTAECGQITVVVRKEIRVYRYNE